MEENEAADLWIDLAPQQCTPFWPQTESMAMHCKYRDSTLVSQRFSVTKNHFTVLRMDKGVSTTTISTHCFRIYFPDFTYKDLGCLTEA